MNFAYRKKKINIINLEDKQKNHNNRNNKNIEKSFETQKKLFKTNSSISFLKIKKYYI